MFIKCMITAMINSGGYSRTPGFFSFSPAPLKESTAERFRGVFHSIHPPLKIPAFDGIRQRATIYP